MSRETQPDDVPATAPTLVKGITLTAVCTIAMAANVSRPSSINSQRNQHAESERSQISNTMAVSIALPTIGDELGIQQDQLQWVTNAYALSSGCLLLMFGRIADVYGRKKTFLAGALWLFAFTLGCAFVKGACCVVAVMFLSEL